MPRTYNPFANSPYPVDPAWGQIGSSLVTALFGDPEARAQQELRQAQMAEMAAQAERARAAAGYDTERTRGVRGQNDTIYGDGQTSLGAAIADPALLAAIRANPEDFTPEQLNQGLGGVFLRNRVEARQPGNFGAVPNGTGLAGVVAGNPMLANPDESGSLDSEGGIVVAARKAPEPPPVNLPAEDEQTLRLIGALMGQMPDENTAYTPEYGDSRQRRDLNSQEKRTRMTADASMYGDRVRAGATVQSARIGASASMANNRMDDERERGLGKFGPGRDGGKPAPRFQPSQLGNMDAEIRAQAPGLPGDLMTRVRVRSVEIAQQTGNPAAAVQQALGEIVEKNTYQNRVLGIPTSRETRYEARKAAPTVSGW